MAASCYLQPIDCDVSTLFETFDSSELPADPGIWHQPLPAAANLLAEGRGTAPRLQKQQQQGRCQSVGIPALAKRNGRRSSSKVKHMSGYKKNRLAISRMEQEVCRQHCGAHAVSELACGVPHASSYQAAVKALSAR